MISKCISSCVFILFTLALCNEQKLYAQNDPPFENTFRNYQNNTLIYKSRVGVILSIDRFGLKVTPSVGYRFTPKIAVGIGPNFQYNYAVEEGKVSNDIFTGIFSYFKYYFHHSFTLYANPELNVLYRHIRSIQGVA